MSVDKKTVKRVAHLARIAVEDDEIETLQNELNGMLAFVEQLDKVDIFSAEAMTSVIPMPLRLRPDVVTAGNDAVAVTLNAPMQEDHYFLVPKVVE